MHPDHSRQAQGIVAKSRMMEGVFGKIRIKIIPFFPKEPQHPLNEKKRPLPGA